MATRKGAETVPKRGGHGGSKRAASKRQKRHQLAFVERREAVVDPAAIIENPLTNPLPDRFGQCLLTEPSISAGALKAGYGPRTARQQVSRLLTNDDIQRCVAWLPSGSATSGVLTRQAVMRNASRRAGTVEPVFSPDQWPVDGDAVSELREEALSMIELEESEPTGRRPLISASDRASACKPGASSLATDAGRVVATAFKKIIAGVAEGIDFSLTSALQMERGEARHTNRQADQEHVQCA